MLAIHMHWLFWSGCLALLDPFWGRSNGQLRACGFVSTPELKDATLELTRTVYASEIKTFKDLVILTNSPQMASKALKCMTLEDAPKFDSGALCPDQVHLRLRSTFASLLMEPFADICFYIQVLFKTSHVTEINFSKEDVISTKAFIGKVFNYSYNFGFPLVSKTWLYGDASGQRAAYFLANDSNDLAVSAPIRDLLTNSRLDQLNGRSIPNEVLQCDSLGSCQILAFYKFIDATPCQKQCREDLIETSLSCFPALADHADFLANVSNLKGDHMKDFRAIIEATQMISASLWKRDPKILTPHLIRAAQNSTYALLFYLSLRTGVYGGYLRGCLIQISTIPYRLIPHNALFGETRQHLVMLCERYSNFSAMITAVDTYEIVMNADLVAKLIAKGFVRNQFNIWIIDAFLKTEGLHVSTTLLKSVERDGLPDCGDFASCSLLMKDRVQQHMTKFEGKINVALATLENLCSVRREIVDRMIAHEDEPASKVGASVAMSPISRYLKVGLDPINLLMGNLHLRGDDGQAREPLISRSMKQTKRNRMVDDIEKIEETIFWQRREVETLSGVLMDRREVKY